MNLMEEELGINNRLGSKKIKKSSE